MQPAIIDYNQKLSPSDRAICDKLASLIGAKLLSITKLANHKDRVIQ